MILLAGRTGKVADVQEATRQLLTAVIHENWWKPREELASPTR